MTSAAYDFFREFGSYCHEHHSPEVALAASTLVSTGVIGPLRVRSTRTLRARLREVGGTSRMFVRDALRRARAGADGRPPEAAPVLCVLPFRRPDYDALVRPLLRGLADQGHAVVVVREPGTTVSWWGRDAGRIELRPPESGLSVEVLREARRDLAGLRLSLRDIVRRFELDAAARHDFATYFTEFVYQASLARGILARVEPALVLGIHFVPVRGWQAALREPRHARRPAVALLQHGAFSSGSGFHDFEGADRVLLWGDAWRRELAGFEALPFRPVPTPAVTGHPGYDEVVRGEHAVGERAAGEHAGIPSSQSAERPRVLYVSTHAGRRTVEPPLDAILEASGGDDGFDLVVKPHPAERPDVHRERIARGAMRPESLAAPADSIADLIRAADVVVGPKSTTLFEAARLRRPVVLWRHARDPLFEAFLHAGDVASIRDGVRLCTREGPARDALMKRQEDIVRDVFGEPRGAVAAGVGVLRELIDGMEGGAS